MMRRRSGLLVALLSVAACTDAPQDVAVEQPPSNTGLRYLGGEAESGFARAIEPREFVFPEDHASHPDYRSEWWYFTGNLATPTGRHFGFELTFFRFATAPPSQVAESGSAWRTDQIWMAHLAVTDSAGRRFFARERLSREALDLAGATSAPLRVWVEDWSATGEQTDGRLAFRLEARDGPLGLSLDVSSTLPPIANGERGLDRKGASPGNASFYYSVPRLNAAGSITIDDEVFPVTGLAWMDREWSTSSLDPGIVGWDWFALHLSDGRSLMVYRLRTVSGESSPYSGGSIVSTDGRRTALTAADFTLTALDHWSSPATGTRYPIEWRLVIPLAAVDLMLSPYLDDQELNLSVRYWEGAVHAASAGAAESLTAQGYMELAGY
jgi:predicted secreted hydrolase